MAAKSLTITDFKKLPGGLSSTGLIYEFPPVISTNSKGRKIEWQITIKILNAAGKEVPIDDKYFSGQLPKGFYAQTNVLSKMCDSEKFTKKTPTNTKKGKNIGRSNETNPFTQALRDALGKYNKQRAKASGNKCYPPMLVQNKEPKSYDLYVQRKLDGVRAVSYIERGKVIIYSRTCKEYYHLDYLRKEIEAALQNNKNIRLDGELYKFGTSLQDISGIARTMLEKKETDELPELDYYIYDCFDLTRPKLTFEQRLNILQNEIFAAAPKFKYLRQLETVRISTKKEADNLFKKYLKEGYEGAILRMPAAPYQFSYNNYHSSNILKMKPVHEEEYKIVDIAEGKYGKAKGALIFVLETKPGGKHFNVTPGLPLEERYDLFKSGAAKKYIGKLLTIKYDDLSKDGVPLRARTEGIVIRDYE